MSRHPVTVNHTPERRFRTRSSGIDRFNFSSVGSSWTEVARVDKDVRSLTPFPTNVRERAFDERHPDKKATRFRTLFRPTFVRSRTKHS